MAYTPIPQTIALILSGLMLAGCGGGGGTSAAAPPAVSAVQTMATCGSTSNKIGKSATLLTRSHRVSGKATVVDDCTIEITNFNYDGGGAQTVFAYGGLAGNYGAGFAIGSNLKGTVFTNQTLKLTLKAGDIDKMDGLSIWCSDVKISFGDGLFQ